jgi:magnesium transporter
MPDHLDASAERAKPRERVEHALADITALLRRHRLVEGLLQEQRGDALGVEAAHEFTESAVTAKSRAELVRTLDRLHAADIAHILEALPLDERL